MIVDLDLVFGVVIDGLKYIFFFDEDIIILDDLWGLVVLGKYNSNEWWNSFSYGVVNREGLSDIWDRER